MSALKTVISENRRPQLPSLTITVMDDEVRVLDTALAAQLGMTDTHQIRDLIKRHVDELEAFGEVSVRRTETGPRGGRPGTAYYLNRQQALLVCILSKTEKAKAVRAEVIRRFDAYEELTRPAPVPVESAFQVTDGALGPRWGTPSVKAAVVVPPGCQAAICRG